ncbi:MULTISPECIES: amidohydrolase family protein [unclassified Haladaptatus]|uniref:amidohydrolase family protein n=1 Tax=unclassified Haladaptatus TaxID=2622732 RepID=UPI0023E873C0|nr:MULTISPECIES: amidohydrolase family protein [unclassified Haladaptatus]
MASKREQYLANAVYDKDEQPVSTLIDAHTHIGQVRQYDLGVTPERMIEYMDSHGIDKAVLFPLESPEGSAYLITTREVLAAASRFPDRFIPFCSIDPRSHPYYDESRFEDAIAEYVDLGARGFGELKCGLPVDDERMQTLYRICGEQDLPILMHIDDQCCTDEPGLPGLERMVQQYPETNFILHAPGWWVHISADVEAGDLGRYPKDPVVRGGRCDELLSEYDNLYADFSMGSGFNALTRDEAYGQEFLSRHHESLIFGSDYLYPGQPVMQFGFFAEFDLSTDQWENICHRNIESLLL